MQIIKHGHYYRPDAQMTCPTCNRVFLADAEECDIRHGLDRVRFEAHCPECGAMVVQDFYILGQKEEDDGV